MLISPPFLPAREADQSDADWLNVAMNSVSSNFIPELGNDTIAGAYPVSMELGWHGGMHLIAPPGEGGTTLPVRTIADGTIIFVRQPKVQNRNDDEPLNYGAPAGSSCWTSDGVVLIRHETDIGASPDGQAIASFSTRFTCTWTLSPMASREIGGSIVKRNWVQAVTSTASHIGFTSRYSATTKTCKN